MYITKLKTITKSQTTDTGMAFTLLCLLIGNVFFTITVLNIMAIFILIITMLAPIILKPIAVLWFNLSNIIGFIVSKATLGIIYYGIITPFGRFVLLFKEDPMNRTYFKKSTKSTFISRDITFSKKDLVHPY